MLSLLLVSRLIEDPEYLRVQLRKLRGHMSIDYVGIGFLALSLGAALQVVLDEGQGDNWFYSPMIATLGVIFPIALVLFIVWELTRSKPVMICGCSRTATSRQALSHHNLLLPSSSGPKPANLTF